MVWIKKLYRPPEIMRIPFVNIYFLGNGSMAFTSFPMEFGQAFPILTIIPRSPALRSWWHGWLSHLTKEYGIFTRLLASQSGRRDRGPPKDTERSVLWCQLLSMRKGVILVNLRHDVYLKSSEKKFTNWSLILKEKKIPCFLFVLALKGTMYHREDI